MRFNSLRKKTIILILASCYIFSILMSCSNNPSNSEKPDISILPEESEPSSTNNQDIEKPDITIEDIDYDITIFCERTGINNFNDDEIKEWEEYIYHKYDYMIDLIIGEKITMLKTDVKEIKEKTNLEGFVYLFSFWQLNRLIDADLLMPVNEYLLDIPEYAVMNDKILASYAERNNVIWAFPFGEMNDRLPNSTRFYNQAWLDKAGVSEPKTLDEFYSYAKYIAENDPDENGVRDTYIDMIDIDNLNRVTDSLYDIWAAFGCYFDMGPISYNPETGLFEDFILSENFIEAASYVRSLVDNGLIYLGKSKESDGVSSYKIASSKNMSALDGIMDFSDWVIGYYLSGRNDSFLINVNPPSTCLAVLKDTKNVKEQMEVFLAILKSKPESFMDFYAGIEGKHYKDNGKNYALIVPENVDELKLFFMDLKLDGYTSEDMRVEFGSLDEEKLYQEMHNQARAELKTLLDSDVAYSVPYYAYSYSLINVNRINSGPIFELFNAIFIENEDISDAVEEYRVASEKIGIPSLINSFLNILK